MEKTLYACPHCHKEVRDLKAHIGRMHPDKAETPPEQPAEQPPAQVQADVLVLKTPEHKPAQETGYHCVGCGKPIRKGDNPCPSCGEELDWSAVNA